MNAGGSKLIVTRTADEDIKMRDLYIKVDDQPERTILYGERLEIPLPPGRHMLLATNRLFKKLTSFDIEEGETAIFQSANVPGGCLYIPLYIVSGTGGYRVTLERTTTAST